MHELSLCQALIRQAARVAEEHDARRITHLHVRIGRLSGVEADLMQQAFPPASQGSVAEGAVLHLEPSPVRIHCPACARDAEVEINRLTCPHCGHWQTQLIGGDELLLVSMDLESPLTLESPPAPLFQRGELKSPCGTNPPLKKGGRGDLPFASSPETSDV